MQDKPHSVGATFAQYESRQRDSLQARSRSVRTKSGDDLARAGHLPSPKASSGVLWLEDAARCLLHGAVVLKTTILIIKKLLLRIGSLLRNCRWRLRSTRPLLLWRGWTRRVWRAGSRDLWRPYSGTSSRDSCPTSWLPTSGCLRCRFLLRVLLRLGLRLAVCTRRPLARQRGASGSSELRRLGPAEGPFYLRRHAWSTSGAVGDFAVGLHRRCSPCRKGWRTVARADWQRSLCLAALPGFVVSHTLASASAGTWRLTKDELLRHCQLPNGGCTTSTVKRLPTDRRKPPNIQLVHTRQLLLGLSRFINLLLLDLCSRLNLLGRVLAAKLEQALCGDF